MECWLGRCTRSGERVLTAWPRPPCTVGEGRAQPSGSAGQAGSRSLVSSRAQSGPQAFLHHGDLLPLHKRRWAGQWILLVTLPSAVTCDSGAKMLLRVTSKCHNMLFTPSWRLGGELFL